MRRNVLCNVRLSLIVVLALPVLVGCDDFAIKTPPSIREQARIQRMRIWGDAVAVIAPMFDRKTERNDRSLFIVKDKGDGGIVEHTEDPPLHRTYDVASSQGRLYLVGDTDSGTFVFERGPEGEDKWVPISEELHGVDFRLLARNNTIVAISDKELYVQQGTAIQRINISNIIDLNRPALPRTMEILGKFIYIGYSMGEFGLGGLYKVSLCDVNGSERLLDRQITSVVSGNNGDLWIAAGNGRLENVPLIGYESPLLLHITDKSEMEVIVGERGFKFKNQYTVPKPLYRLRKPSPIGAFCLSDSGNPIILTLYGIVELTDNKMRTIVQGNFYPIYHIPARSQIPAFSIRDSPLEMISDRRGGLYVASRSVGVFHIQKKNSKYRFQQYLFEERALIPKDFKLPTNE